MHFYFFTQLQALTLTAVTVTAIGCCSRYILPASSYTYTQYVCDLQGAEKQDWACV